MPKRCVGFVVVGDVVTVVDTELPDDVSTPIIIVSDDTWTLQKGDRADAYHVMYRRCISYLKENQIGRVVIKASALPSGSARLGLIKSAELRGVITAASASVASVLSIAKAVISRTYGDRKVDEYLQDDGFWAEKTIGGSLRKNSREAAMMVIAARNG